MKPFEDFLYTLTEDEIAKISNKVNEKSHNIAEKTSNDIGMQVASISLWYSIELLRKYHEWIDKQA